MENKKEPIKVKLSTAIVVFIIFILIALIIGMFVYYNSKQNEKNTNTDLSENVNSNVENDGKLVSSNNQNNVQTENTVATKVEELDINSELIKKLYKYIIKDNCGSELLVYQSQKVTSDNMINGLKLMTVFENLDNSEADEIQTETKSGIKYIYNYFKRETIEKKAKEIFGNNIDLTHENCTYRLAEEIVYKDGIYNRYKFQGGGGYLWEDSTECLIKAEQQGDEVYLYDKYVHIVRDEENYEINDIYDASDKKVKIAESVNLYNQGMYNGTEGLSENEYNKKIISNIEKITNNRIKTFKHTFKKNSDGTYYWYSTEPIE